MLTVENANWLGKAGIAPHVVRFDARIGLIRPSRRHDNGYRLFDKSEVARLGFIRAAKHLAFTLNEIRQIMPRAAAAALPVRTCVPRCASASTPLPGPA